MEHMAHGLCQELDDCSSCRKSLADAVERMAVSFRDSAWKCEVGLCGRTSRGLPHSFNEGELNHHSREGHGLGGGTHHARVTCADCFNTVLSVTRMIRAGSGEECKPQCRAGFPVQNPFRCTCACVGLHHGEAHGEGSRPLA